MLTKTRAIVLHHVKYGESSLVLNLYTEQFGRTACIVSGVRSRKPRFPATLFQPLHMLDVDFYYRRSREIHRLKEVSGLVYYQTIPFNISKSTIALFLAEVLMHCLREEESNPPLFAFLFHAFQLLDASDEGYPYFHHWFLVQLSRYLGFLPHEQLIAGNLSPVHDLPVFGNLSPDSLEALRSMAGCASGPPGQLGLNHAGRTALLESILRYYSLHIDGFTRLKSYAVLQEVFR
ncbi:MAG: DNA repair protein RecO [Bacteroidales bacterium]|nr:DNA repair protein RecO [Bacteroidales bacterium]